MFTTAQLTALQNLAESAMVSQGYAVRIAKTSDGQGGFTKVWNAVTTDPISCRVKRDRRIPTSELRGEAIVEEVSQFVVKVPVGTDMVVTDRFQVVSGPLYEITGTTRGRSFLVEQSYNAVLIDDGSGGGSAGPPVGGGIHGQEDEFHGDGSSVAFTLTGTPIPGGLVLVYVDNVLQRKTHDYSISGTTLTFTFAPLSSPTEPNILVRYWTAAAG